MITGKQGIERKGSNFSLYVHIKNYTHVLKMMISVTEMGKTLLCAFL